MHEHICLFPLVFDKLEGWIKGVIHFLPIEVIQVELYMGNMLWILVTQIDSGANSFYIIFL